MPMKSEAQRGYLWATNPEVAQKFEDKTPPGKRLPEHVKRGVLAEAVPYQRPRIDELRLKRRRMENGKFYGHGEATRDNTREACMNADEVADMIQQIDADMEEWRSGGKPIRPGRTRPVNWGAPANPNGGPVGSSPTGVGNLGYPA